MGPTPTKRLPELGRQRGRRTSPSYWREGRGKGKSFSATHRPDSASVDDGKGPVPDQLLGGVLVGSHALHDDEGGAPGEGKGHIVAEIAGVFTFFFVFFPVKLFSFCLSFFLSFFLLRLPWPSEAFCSFLAALAAACCTAAPPSPASSPTPSPAPSSPAPSTPTVLRSLSLSLPARARHQPQQPLQP